MPLPLCGLTCDSVTQEHMWKVAPTGETFYRFLGAKYLESKLWGHIFFSD